jgi:hypothetical protein
MIIVTSYFGNQKALRREGYTICSVARYDPEWCKTDTKLIQLAPTSDMLKMTDWNVYDAKYQEILKRVDLKFVKAILSQYSKIALCCWEKNLNECHRKQAGEFLSAKLGIEIKEFVSAFPEKEKKSAKPKAKDTQINLF